jgi:hypothetical protein
MQGGSHGCAATTIMQLTKQHDQMSARIARRQTHPISGNDEFVMAPHYYIFAAMTGSHADEFDRKTPKCGRTSDVPPEV